MSRAEFEALPFRNDLVNEPLPYQYYRDRHQSGVFKIDQMHGERNLNWRNYQWWAFAVTFTDDRPRL